MGVGGRHARQGISKEEKSAVQRGKINQGGEKDGNLHSITKISKGEIDTHTYCKKKKKKDIEDM